MVLGGAKRDFGEILSKEEKLTRKKNRHCSIAVFISGFRSREANAKCQNLTGGQENTYICDM